ncbi:Cupredoxin [Artemisia annua]|uniref:Cupredoxin n=1 Tax=Artemisia annua TaxID=35608 RepID=A0A2U1PCD9_ARTAN|nr:Cupredoxin [Artemisia annua]
MAKVSVMRILMLFAATTMLVDLAVAMDHNVGSTAPSRSQYFIQSLGTKRSPGMMVRIEVVKPLPSKTTVPPSPKPPKTTTPPPTRPINGPRSKSPQRRTVTPPSSSITLKLTAGSILGFQLLVMMLLSPL